MSASVAKRVVDVVESRRKKKLLLYSLWAYIHNWKKHVYKKCRNGLSSHWKKFDFWFRNFCTTIMFYHKCCKQSFPSFAKCAEKSDTEKLWTVRFRRLLLFSRVREISLKLSCNFHPCAAYFFPTLTFHAISFLIFENKNKDS